MISFFEIEIEGLEETLRGIAALDEVVDAGMVAGIVKTTAQMEGTAKELCAVDTGGLRESIHSAVKQDGNGAVGIIGTNYENAPYLEFGTGPKGRDTPVSGKYPGPIDYREDGWWMHESQIDAATAEKYHFFKLTTPDGVFYFTNGQPAQPFLYPALMAHKDEAPANIAAEIAKRIKGGGD